MPAGEYQEWLILARMEPFGEARADARNALQACLFANVHRNAKEHPAPFTPMDFIPDFAAPDPEQKRKKLESARRQWEARLVFQAKLAAKLGFGRIVKN